MDEQKTEETSFCGKYRYSLGRVWDTVEPHLVWVMLNPSIADAYIDDATIRRVRSFTKREGYGGLIVVNVFAYRATNPKDMHANRRECDDVNLKTVRLATDSEDVVVAWGQGVAHVPEFERIQMALAGAHSVRCLGYTKGRIVGGGIRLDRQPRHPLMLAKTTPLEAWPLPDKSGEGGLSSARPVKVKPATCNNDSRCELVPGHGGPCGRYPSGPGFWAPF